MSLSRTDEHRPFGDTAPRRLTEYLRSRDQESPRHAAIPASMEASMRRRPLLLLALVAALAAGVVTGCGSGGALSLDPVAAAATKTADEQTFKISYSMDMTVMGQT